MNDEQLPRRRFLTLAGGTAGALALGACSWSDAVRESVTSSPTATTSNAPTTTAAPIGDSRRPLLVVINLAGGNDALNTVVPVTGRYHDLRPDIGLTEEDLLPLDDDHGLHPALAPLLPRWGVGELAVAYGVGLPGQSRSHFEATDAWAAAALDPGSTGWLGRWLDLHPQAGRDPLLAVGLGGGRAVVRGRTASSTVIQRPEQFLLQTAPGMDAGALAEVMLASAAPGGADSDALALVRAGIPRASNAVQIFDQIATETDVAELGRSSVGSLLDVAARLIELNLSTEVVTIDVGGYDTHANQLATHAGLLGDLAIGIDRFLTAVAPLDRDVVVMTTSEFGRRGADNGSGTDHGLAGLQFLVGARVNGGRIVGEAGLDRLDDGDLPIEIDTRSLYAAALGFMGGPVDEVLDGAWDDYDLIEA